MYSLSLFIEYCWPVKCGYITPTWNMNTVTIRYDIMHFAKDNGEPVKSNTHSCHKLMGQSRCSR